MSAELYSTSESNSNVQSTTVGGSKPLHIFIKGQPKITGIIVLILGLSFFIVTVSITTDSGNYMWTVIPPGLLLGMLFIICGILYIVTDHNTSKKTVTASLALSIVTLLGICWTLLHIIPRIEHSQYWHYRYSPEYFDENDTETLMFWASNYEAMGVCVEALFLFYSIVGAIIFIVMSILAGGALRSTKSQAVIVLTTAASETPAE